MFLVLEDDFFLNRKNQIFCLFKRDFLSSTLMLYCYDVISVGEEQDLPSFFFNFLLLF